MIPGLHVIEGFLDGQDIEVKLVIRRISGAPEINTLFRRQRGVNVSELITEKSVESLELVHDFDGPVQTRGFQPIQTLAAGLCEGQSSPIGVVRLGLPNADDPIGRRPGEMRAIRAEGDAVDAVARPAQGQALRGRGPGPRSGRSDRHRRTQAAIHPG